MKNVNSTVLLKRKITQWNGDKCNSKICEPTKSGYSEMLKTRLKNDLLLLSFTCALSYFSNVCSISDSWHKGRCDTCKVGGPSSMILR